MNTVKDGFDEIRERVIPKDAPDVQVKEMKKAFYAGAAWLLHLQGVIAELDEDAAVAVLQSLHNEVKDYALSIG